MALAAGLTALAGCGGRGAPPPEMPADVTVLPDLTAVVHLADHLPPAPGAVALPTPTLSAPARIPGGVDLARFDRLLVSARVRAEGWGAVRLETDREPVLVAHPGFTIPLENTAATQTWEIPLSDAEGFPLHGRATAWTMHLPEGAVLEAVESATLLPRGKRLEVAFGGHNRDALAGDTWAWRLRPGADTRLLVHAGYWQPDGDARGDGVRFEGWLLREGAAPARLFQRAAGPGVRDSVNRWFDEGADLAPWAGQEVTLVLRVDTRAGAEADYAYWGAPMLVTASQPPPGPPVFLISCDTFRADHLSLHGYSRPTTPRLEALAQDAVVFEQAVTNESWTLTAHMSMLTGRHAVHHGMTPSHNLPADIPTLAEILRERGYAGAGHVGHEWWLLPWRGYGRGFSEYGTPNLYRDVFTVHEDMRAFLARVGVPGVFGFLHNYDAHSRIGNVAPYGADDPRFTAFSGALGDAPPFRRPGLPLARATDFLAGHNNGLLRVSPEERTYLIALYDDAIQKVDHAVGEFLDHLKARGLYEDALIIVTSDHGESFDEHGRYLHGEVNEACLRIPLLVKWPGNAHAGLRFGGMVEQMDIFPTVLEAAGIPVPEAVEGRSLRARLLGEAPPVERSFSRRNAWRGMRAEGWKYRIELDQQREMLFDLAKDPQETRDLAATEPARLEAMRAATEAFYRPRRAGWVIGLDSGGTAWQGTVRIASNSRILWAGMDRGNLLHSDAPDVEATFRLDAARPQDAIVVETDPPGAPIRVVLESDVPFTAGHGGTVAPPATRHDLYLSAEVPLGPAPEGGATGPQAWTAARAAAPAAPGDARPADAETEEQLRALGYLDLTN
jgi:arylsulfatase A-like enzyme